ncbi:S8 family serine peptidase [Sphingomonas sp. SM33]|uniref:S8 family serine peptidase n=1 Tax=Sphingomonas telluris TaxID=2907998 RepID=A0ABS9VIF6_9SPHN|nr:S8 family serine peptidase [Sphingomonas telluris]MCH8614752.1 S8 family serine peptidase [Sphingomonas telluris]
MRASWVLYASAAAILGVASPASGQGPDAQSDATLAKISNQYICTFDRSMPGASVRNEANKAAGPVLGQVLHTYEHSIKGFAVRAAALSNGRSPIAEMRAKNPRITGCEEDQVMRAVVAKPSGKPGGGGGSEQTPYGVTMVRGGTTDQSNSGKTAWVIDTGIDFTHPDLNVDVARSVSFVGGTGSDRNGHGTHVSGTIGAKKDGKGVVGVAPGVKLVAVQVLGASGSGSTSGVIAGIDYVADHGIAGDVANMSLGGGYSQALNDAVVAASSKVKFALAAGNEGDNANNHSPASANGPNIYTVAAVDSAKTLASWSNYGKPPVDYADPGVSIYSTYKGGGYATLSGTSMATPHMAGVLLLGNVSNCGTSSAAPDGSTYSIGCH